MGPPSSASILTAKSYRKWSSIQVARVPLYNNGGTFGVNGGPGQEMMPEPVSELMSTDGQGASDPALSVPLPWQTNHGSFSREKKLRQKTNTTLYNKMLLVQIENSPRL